MRAFHFSSAVQFLHRPTNFFDNGTEKEATFTRRDLGRFRFITVMGRCSQRIQGVHYSIVPHAVLAKTQYSTIIVYTRGVNGFKM